MKRFLVFALGIAVLLTGLWYADTHLVSAPSPPGAPPPLPTRTPEETPTAVVGSGPRVVVISLAGAQAARVESYIADGTLPNLARLKAGGAMAQYAFSIDPPLGLAAHASLATGSYPAETGIVGDRFHLSRDRLDRAAEALPPAQAGAEPVWRRAMREARRTAVLFWPGTSLDVAPTLADYTVTGGACDAGPARHEVTFTQALSWTAAPPSFSPLREGRLTIRKDGAPLARVYVLAVDTTDDGKPNYDTFILDRDRQVDAGSARLHLGETAPLVVDELITSGAYFTLTRVDPDRVTLYQSGVYYNQAQPDELARQVNEQFGFFPPDPDGEALARGWITPQDYVRMAEIQSRWMISVTTFVLDAYQPELLFAWQGPAEALQRAFLLVDSRQPKYTPELAAEYDRYVRQGYALADRAVGVLARAVNPEQTTFLVVSDHGMAPVHSQVYINTILVGQKLLTYEKGPDCRIDVAQSKAVAFASGAAAHIYISLRGRERVGTVSQADYRALQDTIVSALLEVKGAEGEPVFSRVLRREDLGRLGLDAPTAGDVFVQAASGYTLNDQCGSPKVLGPAAYYGAGGLAASTPAMQAIFLATGRGVRSGVQVGPVHIVDLVPTVDRLLGLAPAEALAGRVLEEVLLP